MDPDDIFGSIHAIDQSRINRSGYMHEYRVAWPDGSIHWLRSQGEHSYNEFGDATLIRGAVFDVTARRQAEERQSILTKLVEMSRAFVGVSTLSGRVVYLNPAGLAMVGIGTLEEAQQKQIGELLTDPSVELALRRALDRTGYWTGETQFRHFGTGDAIDVDVTVFTINDEGGKPIYLGTMTRDIRERKRVERQLTEINERLKLATTAGGVGIWEFDMVNDRLIWDDQMFRLYGITPDAFTSNSEAWRRRIHPDDLERCDREATLAYSGERDYVSEFRVVWPDGTVHYIRAMGVLQRDATGRPVG